MNDSFDLRVMGLMLRQGRRLNALSWLLMAVASLGLLLGTSPALGAPGALALIGLSSSLVIGLLQAILAMRVDFDADLLLALAEHDDPEQAMAQLDRSLQTLALVGPEKAGRDWPARWRGARRLFGWQFVCLATQAGCLVLAWVATR